MTIPMQVRQEAKEHEGLKDGGHTYLLCSNCGVPLADVWVVRPHEPETWPVRASNCPFCDEDPKSAPLGGSYLHEVKGGFVYGGYGVVKEDDQDDAVMKTFISDVSVGDGVINLKIGRAK